MQTHIHAWFLTFVGLSIAFTGCSDEAPQSGEDNLTSSCSGAQLDDSGVCRNDSGRFAPKSCCPTPPVSCEDKACGVDCTPQGSDEPFNCNASGECVAAGADLGCEEDACAEKACGVDCTPGGSDEPFNCNASGECVVTGEDLDCEADPCAGKACGVDCTPPGSDEPFNCDVGGECVATGADLGC